MKNRQYIEYENYKNNKLKYGHISSWALWNEDVYKLKCSSDINDYSLRKELLIANSEEEYIKKDLNKLLHGDVVILGLNMSSPKESPNKPNALLSILNKYKDKSYNRKRYEELVGLSKNDDLYTFVNMYRDAGKGTSIGSGYANEFMKSDILNGSYMTDFIKFIEDEDELLPAGVPESKSKDITVTSCLSKDKINIQAKGLKEELDSLGIKPKVFILIYKTLVEDCVKNAISTELGYEPHFEYLYHYSPQGLSYKKRGFKSYEELYSYRIKEIIKNIALNIEF